MEGSWYSPHFHCFSGLNWELPLLPPPAAFAGANVPAWTVPEPPGLCDLPSTDFSITVSSFDNHSVVFLASEEATEAEVLEGGEGLVLGLAQMKLNHWAGAGQDRRRTRARGRQKLTIVPVWPSLTVRNERWRVRIQENHFKFLLQPYFMLLPLPSLILAVGSGSYCDSPTSLSSSCCSPHGNTHLPPLLSSNTLLIFSLFVPQIVTDSYGVIWILCPRPSH